MLAIGILIISVAKRSFNLTNNPYVRSVIANKQRNHNVSDSRDRLVFLFRSYHVYKGSTQGNRVS